MRQRFDIYIFLVMLLALPLGCFGDPDSEIIVDLPEIVYEPPVIENSIVFSIVTTKERALGFAVYSGSELNSESLLDAESEKEMRGLVKLHIAKMKKSNPDFDTIVIKCAADVRSRDVETIKSVIDQLEDGTTMKLFVGIRDDATVSDDD